MLFYESFATYGDTVGRGIENEFQSFAEYHDFGILVWSPLLIFAM
jgi:hypothetical protein